MNSRFVKSLFIVVLIIYLLFLIIARVPASWGAWAAHKAVPQIWLTAVEGTIWHGRAGGGAVALGDQIVPIERLQWKMKPWRLLTLNICAEVDAEMLQQPASGVFCQAPGNVLSARNVDLTAPMGLINQWLTVQLSGLASVQLESLRMKEQRVQSLDGNFSWRDARWHNSERWVPLGAFAADLTGNDKGGLHFKLFDLDGPFKVDLTGDLVLNEEPTLRGTVAPSAQAPSQITQALEFVGEPMDDGSFRIAWPPGT